MATGEDKAIDDRGRACSLAALSGRQVGVRALGLPALADPHTTSELAVTERLELALSICGGVVGAVIWQLVHLKVKLLGMPGLCLGLVVIPPVTAMITWRLTLGLVRRRRFRRLADVYLGTGRCASCGYELEGLEPDGDDGCVACPECGAAWRAARLRRG